jgi:hypothetical protein
MSGNSSRPSTRPPSTRSDRQQVLDAFDELIYLNRAQLAALDRLNATVLDIRRDLNNYDRGRRPYGDGALDALDFSRSRR